MGSTNLKGVVADDAGGLKTIVFYSDKWNGDSDKFQAVKDFCQMVEKWGGKATILRDSDYENHDGNCLAVQINITQIKEADRATFNLALERNCTFLKGVQNPSVEIVCKTAKGNYGAVRGLL